jgi:hypothetical protein
VQMVKLVRAKCLPKNALSTGHLPPELASKFELLRGDRLISGDSNLSPSPSP